MMDKLSSLVLGLLLLGYAAGEWPSIEFVFVHRLPPGEIDSRDPVIAICQFIPPGDCCKPHRPELLMPHENLDSIHYGATGFSVLMAGQIGFGWGATGSNYEDVQCGAGNPILRLAGPNQFPWDPWDDEGGYITHPAGGVLAAEPSTPATIVFAASWIDLRRRFPPDSADSRYLQWQGVRGLIWGSGRWTAESQGVPLPRRHRVRVMNSWSPHGTAYLQAPTRWRHPDVYQINGTNYTAFDGIYKAEDGRVLDLSGDTV